MAIVQRNTKINASPQETMAPAAPILYVRSSLHDNRHRRPTMPTIIYENLVNVQTPLPPGEQVRSRTFNVHGAQQVNMSLPSPARTTMSQQRSTSVRGPTEHSARCAPTALPGQSTRCSSRFLSMAQSCSLSSTTREASSKHVMGTSTRSGRCHKRTWLSALDQGLSHRGIKLIKRS